MNELNVTNSFIGGDLNILRSNISEDPSTEVLNIRSINMDESYISSAFGIIMEMNRIITNNKIAFYEMAKDSMSNTPLLLESFSDYYMQADAVIGKFIKFLRVKLDTFFDSMERFIDSNEVINSHKKDLDNIVNYNDDSVEGYMYTIDDNTPNMGALDAFNASLFDRLFKPTITDYSTEQIRDTITSMDLEAEYEKFRGSLINIEDTLDEKEFINRLYKVYRNDDLSTRKIDIDAKKIKTVADEWFNFNAVKSELNRQFKHMENSYEIILNKISKVCKNNNGLTIHAFNSIMPGDARIDKIDGKTVDTQGMMMSSDMMLQLDIYCKAKIDQLQKYTDYTCMAFCAKMDAIKAKYNQYRVILLNAIDVLDHPAEYYDATKRINKPTNVEEIISSKDDNIDEEEDE